MDFFTKVSDGLFEATTTVTAKAKELAEVNKLNNKIRADRLAMTETFAEIGKAVYEHRTSEDQELDFAGQYQKIEDLKADIQMCKDYIRAIRGTVVCPSCGAEVEENATFCKECGAKITE